MGAGVSRQDTVRPTLVRVMSPASESTPRCFMIAGSETGNGRASSETESSSPSPNRAISARRVGSARAAKVRSSTGC